MPELRVPPGCTGLQMEDGSRYDASRSGRLTVDRPEHVKAIMKASEASGGPIARAIHGAPSGTSSRYCPECTFIGYGWQRDCPKGHGEMLAGRPPRQDREAGGVSAQS
jgi:hypothetical protein